MSQTSSLVNEIYIIIKSNLFKVAFALFIFIVLIQGTGTAIADENKSEVIEAKIAKGYSDKFCNALGMGMSKESALKLTILENSKASFNPSLWLELTFSGEKNIAQVNDESMVKEVANNVYMDCGYPIGIKNEEDIEEFARILYEQLNSL